MPVALSQSSPPLITVPPVHEPEPLSERVPAPVLIREPVPVIGVEMFSSLYEPAESAMANVRLPPKFNVPMSLIPQLPVRSPESSTFTVPLRVRILPELRMTLLVAEDWPPLPPNVSVPTVWLTPVPSTS